MNLLIFNMIFNYICTCFSNIYNIFMVFYNFYIFKYCKINNLKKEKKINYKCLNTKDDIKINLICNNCKNVISNNIYLLHDNYYCSNICRFIKIKNSN